MLIRNNLLRRFRICVYSAQSRAYGFPIQKWGGLIDQVFILGWILNIHMPIKDVWSIWFLNYNSIIFSGFIRLDGIYQPSFANC